MISFTDPTKKLILLVGYNDQGKTKAMEAAYREVSSVSTYHHGNLIIDHFDEPEKYYQRKFLFFENPEIRLHPSLQARCGAGLVNLVASGRQVMVETHSDHIFNTTRVAVKKGIISKDDLEIYHFYENSYQRLFCDSEGLIDEWPKGFFDEWENKLDELMR